MALDVVTIWNQALSAAGSRGLISSPTERGREADLCRLWYPAVRDAVLKAASWPCASKYSRLGLLAERTLSTWDQTQPAPGWAFAYALPSDLLAPRHLHSFARFTRGQFNGQTALMADEVDAVLHYTFRQEDVTQWDAGLDASVVATLAAALVRPMAGKPTLARELIAQANETVLLARTEAANESEDNFDALPSWIAARGFSPPPQATRFFWPYENLSILGA